MMVAAYIQARTGETGFHPATGSHWRDEVPSGGKGVGRGSDVSGDLVRLGSCTGGRVYDDSKVIWMYRFTD